MSTFGFAGRVATAAWRGLQTTLSHTFRVLHQLFLEVVGFLFLCVAVLGGFAAWREYMAFRAGSAPLYRTVVAVAFTLVFAWWGVNSFWRARKKAKAISDKR
jgi:uncharacterized membrane protein YraQ (UPF0718 family)